jgi:hypothetical protein
MNLSVPAASTAFAPFAAPPPATAQADASYRGFIDIHSHAEGGS